MIIRKYKKKDRLSVERIHFETGFLGSSMSKFLTTNRLWKEEISYYLNFEKNNCFVLEVDGKVRGYLISSFNKSEFKSNLGFVYRVFKNYFLSLFSSKKDRVFWSNNLKHFFDILFKKSKELDLKTPSNSVDFHINIYKDFRGKNAGSKILKVFEKHAKSKKVKNIIGISYETSLNNNKNFWIKNGFVEYSKVRTLFWDKYIEKKEKINLICYSKKL
jgi:GNAT superfamily N-acetyltransferase